MRRLLSITGVLCLAALAVDPGVASRTVNVAPRDVSLGRPAAGPAGPANAQAVRSDTTWFGGHQLIGGDYYALPGSSKNSVAWTFDRGTGPFPPLPADVVPYGEGWKAHDATANTTAYFRRIDAALDLGPGVPAPVLFGTGSLWVGVDRPQAEALCWPGGPGYGNDWRQRVVSEPLSYSGIGSVNLGFRYFLDTDPCFDGAQVYLLRQNGSELLLNPYPPGTCPTNSYFDLGFSGHVGSYTSPAVYTRSILPFEIGGPQTIRIIFELKSDLASSDEDSAFTTTWGPLGIDNVTIIGGGINKNYTFDSGLQNWTPQTGAPVGGLAGTADLSCYTIVNPTACALSGNVMEMHAGLCDGGTHPDQQHVYLQSPICQVGDGSVSQSIFLDSDLYGELSLENGVFFRPGWEYYPWTCPTTGQIGWSPRVGIDTYYYLGPTALCFLERISATDPPSPGTLVPGTAQMVRAVFELVHDCTAFGMPCTGITNATPLIDNLAVGVVPPPPPPPLPDLAVIEFSTQETRAVPGEDLFVEFTIQNLGPGPTTNLILNYIFVWNAESMTAGAQLHPTQACVAHTFQTLQHGQTDHHGLLALRIPADTPMDTLLTLAVVTNYGGGEAETDDTNNVRLLTIPCGPRQMVLSDAGTVMSNSLDLPRYDDQFEFQADIGDVVFAESYAARDGSALDSRLLLLGPQKDSLLAGEGDIREIDPDSRVCSSAVQAHGWYRVASSGQDSTVGSYRLEVRKGMPEAEPNNDLSSATPFEFGQARIGTIGYPGDVDYYVFQGVAGQVLTLDVDADEMFEVDPGSVLDPVVVLRNAAGDTLLLDDDADEYDPRLFFPLPATASYYVGIEDSPGGGMGNGFPDYRYVFRLTESTDIVKPDLVPLNLISSVPEIPPGTPFTLQYQTWNNGGVSTFAGGVSVGIYLSSDPVIEGTDEILDVGDFEGNLAPGGFHAGASELTIPESIAPGTYYLGVILDPTHSEVELNEGNNTASVPLTVLQSTGVDPDAPLPRRLALLPSRPNPAPGSTAIEYWLPAGPDGRSAQHHVRVEISDVTGRTAAVLVDQVQNSGIYVVQWDGRAEDRTLPSGVYFQRLTVDGSVVTRRLTLIR
jgi:hypothetical protein